MSVTIEIEVYDQKKLKQELKKRVGQLPDGLMDTDTFVILVMSTAGIAIGNYYVLQHCDYWDDYDPWSNVIYFTERYYQFDKMYEVLSAAKVISINEGANEEDLCDAVGVDWETLPPHPDSSEDDEE